MKVCGTDAALTASLQEQIAATMGLLLAAELDGSFSPHSLMHLAARGAEAVAATAPGAFVTNFATAECCIQAADTPAVRCGWNALGAFGFDLPAANCEGHADVAASHAAEPLDQPEQSDADASASVHHSRSNAIVGELVHLAPRIFVLSSNGRTVEFLRPGLYDAHVAAHRGQQGVTELRHSANGVEVHRFVQQLTARSFTPEPLPVADGMQGQAPEPLRAIAALRVPSRLYPAPYAALVMPRAAASAARPARGLALPPVLLVQEFLLQEAPQPDTIAACVRVCERAAQQSAQAAQEALIAASFAEVRAHINPPHVQMPLRKSLHDYSL